MYFDKFRQKCESLGYKLYGMNRDEIRELTGGSVSFPKAYTELMSILGHGTTAPCWNGQDFFGYAVPRLYDYAAETLAENGEELSLKETDFVFFMSQGVIFAFFDVTEGDDPPVYVYTEAVTGRFIKVSEHLSDFIWNYCFEPEIAFEEIV